MLIAVAAALLSALLLPALAVAHIERASYWPDPNPDCSIHPCAGGEVPTARPLSTAASTAGAARCTTSRSVVVKLKGSKGQRLRSARIYVNGRRVRTLRARKRLPTRFTLKGLPTGFVTVALAGTTTRGKRVSSRRVVHICVGPAGKRASTRAVAGPGATRVVCQADSLTRTQHSVAEAESVGYVLRPSQPRVKITAAQGNTLVELNRQLLDRCGYHSIQDAVTDSRNNDRVVIMPGIYTEPKSRSAPTHDPKCAQYTITNDHNTPGALSYNYQWHCPNDANLIAVLGREPGAKAPPQPPLEDRHGIPDAGPCVRCNLQVEGSGASPDDVVVDGGSVAAGDKANGTVNVKDVGFHVDRADGFVLRNVKIRHVNEHGIYVLESDGVLLDRFKAFYADDYGVLTFVEDHFLMQNCDAMGSGDSGLYPGASADTGTQRKASVYPTFRYSSEIANCDSHHNSSGYSGTDGNAVHLHDNNFYDNALGFTTDVFTAPGHPGFPQDSDLIENNNFYSNNFNPYVAGSDIRPTVPVPVGTGLWIAGGNDNIVRNNHFWNNWRRGIMLFAVPDQVVCGPAGIDPTLLAGCNPTAVPPSTSYRNQFYGNTMGRSPSGEVLPNGTGDVTTGRTDFWWDQYLGNTGNCWHDNTGKAGTPGSVTTTPPSPFLPSACNSSSTGTFGPQQEPELLNCLGDIEFDTSTCPWFTTPSKP